MAEHRPLTNLATHQVVNQPPPLEDYNAAETDAALREAVHREGSGRDWKRVAELGRLAGGERLIELGRLANRHPPELRTHDRFGRRIDEVEFHPAYHELLSLAIAHQIHSIAWNREGSPAAGHVTHAALLYLLGQVESGVCCPIAMTYAVVPSLRHEPDLAAEWEPRVLSGRYDPRVLPADRKTGVTFGMAMTEKQGGSDVRANTTRAQPLGGEGYELTGHKWFCSAPNSDAFLTLAQAPMGLSCFLVPRWRPDGTRNPFLIQRLKEKLGNRSNASSEIEYAGTLAFLVGEEGRGVATIIDMVHHTRLDAALAAAGLMRQGVVQAIHHCRHRRAFGKRLIEQPLMLNVLADLALESEAATVTALRIARGFDESDGSEGARQFTRLATAVAKYWLNKLTPNAVYEALECHGGAGYVEESIMPRLYREAPLNSIWEGSGNVICLDVLRASQRQPESVEAFFAEVGKARGGNPSLDRRVDGLRHQLSDPSNVETRARRLTEEMALCLQGALMVQHAPPLVADAFCRSRLGGDWGGAYGTLPADIDFERIVERAFPPQA